MKNTKHILKWLLQTSKSYRLQALINVLVGLLGVALDFGFILSTKLAIDIATGRSDSSLNLATAFLIGIMLSQIALGFAKRWIAALLGVKAQNRMQQRLFRRLMESEWRGLERRHSGDILNRLERDVRDVTTTLTETIPSVFCISVRFLAAFFYLFSMDQRLALIVAVIAPIFALLSRIYVKKMRSITSEVRETDSKVQSILTESIQHRMVLKTLERTGTMSDKLADTQAVLRQQVRHRTLFSSTSATLLHMGFGASYLITFIWGANRLYEGTITYGMMVAFTQLVGQIQMPFRDMTRFIPALIGALTASERLIELEDAPLEEQGEPILFPEGAGIRITDVSYAYDSQKRTILDHLTYDFTPGSTTAIMGETGVGKTTLIRLILALLKPQSGKVELYGKGPQSGKVEQYGKGPQTDLGWQNTTSASATEVCVPASPLTRCNLVYVPQGNTLFSGSIRDNLLLGNPKASEEQMKEALHLSCADFVLSLPDGLDSMCGEMGVGLSEGQAQRISIARALLREGNILLLDEATSALDIETEQQLLQNLHHKKSGQTVIFITHRTAVIEHCDQVLKLSRQS